MAVVSFSFTIGIAFNLNKLSIKFGELVIVNKGKVFSQYSENETANYMKNSDIEISVNAGSGNKNFVVEMEKSNRSLAVILKSPAILVSISCSMIAYGVMNLIMTSSPIAIVGCGFGADLAASVVSAHALAMFAPSFITGKLIEINSQDGSTVKVGEILGLVTEIEGEVKRSNKIEKIQPSNLQKKEEIKEKDNVIKLDPIKEQVELDILEDCLLYTSPSPRDLSTSRMPSSA